MTTVIPPYLSPGDTVAIVATARWIDADSLREAARIVAAQGFRVLTAPHVSTRHFQLAGTDAQRAADLQQAIDDPAVRAILIARGGYGTVRLLDGMDWSTLMKEPRWICGYSDITALHSVLNGLGLATLHSVNALDLTTHDPEAIESLFAFLSRRTRQLAWTCDEVPTKPVPDIPLPLLGGNLSVLCSLLGSGDFLPSREHILLLEDVGEYLYHIDRMLVALRRSGALHHTRAIVCGGFTEMKDNTRAFQFAADNPWGSDARSMVLALGDALGIPVYTGMPAGHIKKNLACPLGLPVLVSVEENRVALRWQ
jgi:muramoyltetrapeptide carboxypeptidase